MFKKIALLSFLCLSTAQAEWQTNVGSKLVSTSLKAVGATAASYTVYKVLDSVVDKLLQEHKITYATAQKLKTYLKIKAYILPLAVLARNWAHPSMLHGFTGAKNALVTNFTCGLNLIQAERILWDIIKNLLPHQ